MQANDIYTTLNCKLSKLLLQAASWSRQDPWNKRIKIAWKTKAHKWRERARIQQKQLVNPTHQLLLGNEYQRIWSLLLQKQKHRKSSEHEYIAAAQMKLSPSLSHSLIDPTKGLLIIIIIIITRGWEI
jgi:hypothetical protein